MYPNTDNDPENELVVTETGETREVQATATESDPSSSETRTDREPSMWDRARHWAEENQAVVTVAASSVVVVSAGAAALSAWYT